MNVYQATDYCTDAASEQLMTHTWESMWSYSYSVPCCSGDCWRLEYRHSMIMQFYGHCTLFLNELNLSFADLNYADEVGFTYLGHNGSKSWHDHVAVSSRFFPSITNVYTINDGRNVSDHNFLVFCMDSSCTVVDYRFPTVTEPTARARYKPYCDHINRYQNVVGHSLVSLNCALDDDIV